MQRKIEVTILLSLAVLVVAGLIALAVRGKRRVPLTPGGPMPPEPQ